MQDGTEYTAERHAHMTSTSAHINPPPEPAPMDTSNPYSKKANEKASHHTTSGTPNIERQAPAALGMCSLCEVCMAAAG